MIANQSITRRAFGSSMFAAAVAGPGHRITGSFFDLIHPNVWDATYWTDTCLFWKEDNWRALMADMHGIGITTAICLNTAFWGRPLFPGYGKTVGTQFRMGCPDPLGACVDEAERRGMKMFFGMGLRGRVSEVRDYSAMQPPWPDIWFEWNTALASALVDRYGHRPCFAGLYIPYEIDFRKNAGEQVELYERLVKKYLRPAIGKVNLLASPGTLGNHTALEQFVAQVERTGIDIVAPQDYGGRSRDVARAVEYARANARALERVAGPLKEIGVSLWSNIELFDYVKEPHGRRLTIGGPIERVRQQIEIQGSVADKLICYQYQGLMNRRTELVNIGHPSAQLLYRDYVSHFGVGR